MIDRATDQDTIVALATPEGHAALGVVRLSGPEAWTIAAQALRTPERFTSFKPRKAHLVDLVDGAGTTLDQAVVLPWKGPESYTGEDLVEFSCHGGRETLRLVIQRLRELGARPAEPGEYTRRAFINGKLTLEQAEAVAALIDARTSASVKAAVRVLEGGLGGRIRTLHEELSDLLAGVEIGLDFVEEEIETYDRDETLVALRRLSRELKALEAQHRAGKFLRHGALVVIAGPPNTGKSTLLNRILGYERAIVSDTPGTTRDFLDVTVDWNGFPVHLVDTAGLRASTDSIEIEGTRRAKELLERADRILWLLTPPDWTPPPSRLAPDKRLILVHNKADLGAPPEGTPSPALHIAATSGEGVPELIDRVAADLLEGYDPGELLVLEERHARRLTDARIAVDRAARVIKEVQGDELLASELRDAASALGEITGVISTDDLLNNIFSRFCIGK